MRHRGRHSIWFRMIAAGLVCLFLANDIVYAQPPEYVPVQHTLAPVSLFRPITRVVNGIRTEFTIRPDKSLKALNGAFDKDIKNDSIFKRILKEATRSGEVDEFGSFNQAYYQLVINSLAAVIDMQEERGSGNVTGRIVTELYIDNDDIVLTVTDNGKSIEFESDGDPIRREQDIEKKRRGYGMIGVTQGTEIVRDFCGRHGGNARWYPLDVGTKAEIRIPKANIDHKKYIRKDEHIAIEDDREKLSEIHTALMCRMIEERAAKEKSVEDIYLDDILLWKNVTRESFQGIDVPLWLKFTNRGVFHRCRFELLPGEIRIYPPERNICIRYYDSRFVGTLVPDTNWSRTKTHPINKHITRQIIYTTRALPSPLWEPGSFESQKSA